MTDLRTLKKEARDSFSEQMGLTIGVTFVAGLLNGGGISFFNNNTINLFGNIPDSIMPIIIAAVAFLGLIGLALFIIGPAVRLGLNLYYIKLLKREEVTFSTLFQRFGYLGKALGLTLFITLFTVLWSFLLIIPGIIAAISYSMAPYIMAENPEIGIREAVNMSKSMMYGHKMDYFVLGLTFIGWCLLAIL